MLGYLDVLRAKKPVGQAVAVVGAGGIGFDVCPNTCCTKAPARAWMRPSSSPSGAWTTGSARGGIQQARIGAIPRKVYLLQRKTSKVGDGLGKTTGWIHRTSLKNRSVEMIPGVSYRKVDDAGLHITVDGNGRVFSVDNILCAGQDPQRELQAELLAAGCAVHLIGGADKAVELDAKRAIQQGTELAQGQFNVIPHVQCAPPHWLLRPARLEMTTDDLPADRQRAFAAVNQHHRRAATLRLIRVSPVSASAIEADRFWGGGMLTQAAISAAAATSKRTQALYRHSPRKHGTILLQYALRPNALARVRRAGTIQMAGA